MIIAMAADCVTNINSWFRAIRDSSGH